MSSTKNCLTMANRKPRRGIRGSLFTRQIIIAVLAFGVGMFKSAASIENSTQSTFTHNATHHHELGPNCTPAAIEEFPRDFFTPYQRNSGGIIVHIIIATYLILGLAIICDDYFVPVLEIICDSMHLSNDVAGATFMAAGTSSPEFFANIMGTFVTESDLGIGTIVGSAVFNIFGVIAVCGLFTGQRVPIDWYPITRDCLVYGITVIVLVFVLIDEKVQWWESLIMIISYFGYILLMYFNTSLERWAYAVQKSIKKKIYPASGDSGLSTPQAPPANESTPLHNADKATQVSLATATVGTMTSTPEISVPPAANNHHQDAIDVGMEDEIEDEPPRKPWNRPEGEGVLAHVWWVLYFPLSVLFFLTIPDVRYRMCGKLYPVSFLMCMAWIGVVSYVVTWMITIIGFTFHIPDSVMGLSFLAVGTSIPEVFSSLIVSKQGKGSMAVSNSIGSNTFDILMCLGMPWLVKGLMRGAETGQWFVIVNSQALAYTVISLFVSLLVLYAILVVGRFILTRTLGLVCLIIYLVFLTISILFELNVFFQVNLPPCPSEF